MGVHVGILASLDQNEGENMINVTAAAMQWATDNDILLPELTYNFTYAPFETEEMVGSFDSLHAGISESVEVRVLK